MSILEISLAIFIYVLVLLATSEALANNNHNDVVKFSVDGRPDAKTDKFCNLAFKDCGSVSGKIINVSFNATCSSSGFAILKRGTVIQLDYQFQTFNVEPVLKSSVHGKIGILPWVSFPLSNPDACTNSGLDCPIKAHTTLDYKPLLNVLTEYPVVQVIVKWELQNQNGTDVFCAVMPAQIVE